MPNGKPAVGQTAKPETLPEKQKSELESLRTDFGEIFFKRDGKLLLNPFWAVVTLDEARGHLNKISGKFSIASEGYYHLNKVASVNLVTPLKITVDGTDRNNPHVERNPITRAIESVNLHKMGIGYSPVGNLVVVDKVLFYNIHTYFLQSLQAKMKKMKDVKDPPIQVGTIQDKPQVGKWVFYVITEPLGLWANYEDPLVIDCLEEHIQRQRFGERIAQTILDRAILRSHPAIGVSRVDAVLGATEGHAKATVKVIGWRHTMAADEVQDVMGRAEKGSLTPEKADVIDVDVEEEAEVIEEVATAPEEAGALFGKEKGKEEKRENGHGGSKPGAVNR